MDIGSKKEVERRLRQLDALRQAVATMEGALQVLTPEERLVVQLMLICPEKNAAQKLCQMLCVEQSSVYRRRDRAMEKLALCLQGHNAAI